jgi:hypothetical protein
MLPLIPKSVKIEPDISARLKTTANLIGYSENQFIVEAVKAMLDVGPSEDPTVLREARRAIVVSKRRQPVVGSVMQRAFAKYLQLSCLCA